MYKVAKKWALKLKFPVLVPKMLVQNLRNPFSHQYFHLSYFSHLLYVLSITLVGSVEDLNLNSIPDLIRFPDLGLGLKNPQKGKESHVLKFSGWL